MGMKPCSIGNSPDLPFDMDQCLSLEASAYDLPEITVGGVVHVQTRSAFFMFGHVCMM